MGVGVGPRKRRSGGFGAGLRRIKITSARPMAAVKAIKEIPMRRSDIQGLF